MIGVSFDRYERKWNIRREKTRVYILGYIWTPFVIVRRFGLVVPLKAHWQYLKYVLRHKWFVFKGCLKYEMPWRGIVHDLSKFLPDEWLPYAAWFYAKDRNDQDYSKSVFDDAVLRQ